jgi:hypothetical protein
VWRTRDALLMSCLANSHLLCGEAKEKKICAKRGTRLARALQLLLVASLVANITSTIA